MLFRPSNTLKTLTLAATLAAGTAFAQNTSEDRTAEAKEAAAISQEALPSAPSAVLAKQAESLSRDPGSSFRLNLSTVPGPGVPIEQPQAGPLSLSIDDAIALALERNVRLQYDKANQREVKGDTRGVLAALEPDLKFAAQSNAQEINLAAMGFKPSKLAAFGLDPATFPTIVKVNTTNIQISASQTLFNMADIEFLKASRSEIQVIDYNELGSEGEVVLATGTAYLKVLADTASLANAQAQERSARVLFSQATDKLKAGVGTNLDALRGQVEYQQRQQATVAAAAALAKDTIQLNRIMGVPANQALALTDAAPFAELAGLPLDAAKITAYAHRKDWLSLGAQVDVATKELRAVKYQRLPTLAFNGFYGVLGQTDGMYHGVFAATGSLKFPIFREAQQRGQEETIGAQLMSLRQRQADLRVTIEAQIRTAMLDVESSAQLVKVAQSNVDLARQELSDERDRFAAGIDDNLPVVDAEAAVTGAEANMVQALYQYNVAKLTLARQTGVVESRYRTYLGK